ncbi:MAG: S-layer homology domain-containing protein [Oscillospiraceae bacterium]|nr:S-layer homology domain-containing protein [Oscillospiraceae bacterium]
MKRRVMSLLLALVMLFGMVPVMAQEASAYESKIWKVYTFEGLKEALESPKAEEVYVMAQIVHTYTYEDSINGVPIPEIHVQGNKTLYTQGFLIACIDESNINLGKNQNVDGLDRTLIVVEKGATLIVDAPDGNADWDFENINYYYKKSGIFHGGAFLDKNHHYQKIVKRNLFDVYGTLVLNGGRYISGGSKYYENYYWLWTTCDYDALWGNTLTVQKDGYAVVNNATMISSGCDVDVRNITVNAQPGSKLDINNSKIYGSLGARPLFAANNSDIRIRSGEFHKYDADDMRIMSSEPFKTKEFDADPRFGIPDDAWKNDSAYMTITTYETDSDEKIYKTTSEKQALDLSAEHPELSIVCVNYTAYSHSLCRLQSDVTNNGYQVGTKNQYADTITFNPKTGTARLLWRHAPFYVSNEYNPYHDAKFEWRIWKGRPKGEEYLNPDYTYSTSKDVFYIDLQKMKDIPWADSPVWTVECYSFEYLNIEDEIGECFDYTDMVTVNIDALSFASQTPNMGGEYTKDYDYTVGDSAKFGFSATALPSAWKNDGYSIVTQQELYNTKGQGLYKGNSSTIDLKDYIKEPGKYLLWQWIDLKKNGESVNALRKLFYINAVGAPKTLQGSVHYTSAVSYDKPVTIGFKGEIAELPLSSLHYQWHSLNGSTWIVISGATGSSYTPKYGDSKIRVKVTADGYEGALYSAERAVEKNDNLTTPERPTMTSSQKTVTITNYSDKQEYVYSTTQLDGTKWSQGTAISGKIFTVPEYGTYYVYTRYKATNTTNTGLYLNYGWVTPTESGSGTTVQAWKLYYPEYPTSGAYVFVPVGKTVTVEYGINPTNANYDLPVLKSNSTAIATVAQNASAKTITITGKQAGTTYVYPTKAGSGYNWQDHPNKSTYNLYIRVYDPNNMVYGDFTGNAEYPDVTIKVNETYTPDSPETTGVTLTPEGADKVFKNFRWYTVVSSMTGFQYATTDGNGVISVDPASGKITALKEGQATVYLFALKDADKDNVPATSYNYLGYYVVKVEKAPEIPAESITLHPDKLNLAVGEQSLLTATVTPSNASTSDEVSLTSSDPTVAEVNMFGIVTAKAPGTTTITLKAGALTASCEVTVYAPDHEHAGTWIPDGSSHYRICEICGQLETGSHKWGGWDTAALADCENPGMNRHMCEYCEVQEYVPTPALGHMESVWKYDETQHWIVCLNEDCGKYIREKEAHDFDTNGYCTTCGYRKEAEKEDTTALCPKDDTCPMAKFADLNRNSWYHDGVHFCIEKGLMNGMGNGAFMPNKELSRAMVVTILYRIEGSPEVNATSPFEDVKPGVWYHDAITWAASNGIANGVSATRFAPDRSVTREQTAAFLYRYAERIGRDISPRADLAIFPDASQVSGYAKEYISWAVATGLITGVGRNGVAYLMPIGTTTRAQYSTIVYRFLVK